MKNCPTELKEMWCQREKQDTTFTYKNGNNFKVLQPTVDESREQM